MGLALADCSPVYEDTIYSRNEVRNAFDGVAGNGLADSARHATGCHVTQEPSVRNAFDDVTPRARLEAGIQLLSVLVILLTHCLALVGRPATPP